MLIGEKLYHLAILTLAADPFVVSDYAVKDESGRDIDHLLVDAWVLAYWIDHAVREVRIVEIEEA